MNAIALYKIAAEVEQALSLCDEDGGIPENLEDHLEGLQLAFDEKALAVVSYRQNLTRTAETLDAEIRRLKDWKDQCEGRAEWLKAYLLRCMIQTGAQKIETAIAKVSVCLNSQPTVTLFEGAAVPKQFQRVKTVIELDKAAVVEAWKAKKPIPSEITVKVDSHLRIK